VQKDFAVESFFFVAAAAYSEIFCDFVGKYLYVIKLHNAHIMQFLSVTIS